MIPITINIAGVITLTRSGRYSWMQQCPRMSFEWFGFLSLSLEDLSSLRFIFFFFANTSRYLLANNNNNGLELKDRTISQIQAVFESMFHLVWNQCCLISSFGLCSALFFSTAGCNFWGIYPLHPFVNNNNNKTCSNIKEIFTTTRVRTIIIFTYWLRLK